MVKVKTYKRRKISKTISNKTDNIKKQKKLEIVNGRYIQFLSQGWNNSILVLITDRKRNEEYKIESEEILKILKKLKYKVDKRSKGHDILIPLK